MHQESANLPDKFFGSQLPIMIHPTDTVKAQVILNNVNYNQLQLEGFSVFLEG
jgi:hypothetical protein